MPVMRCRVKRTIEQRPNENKRGYVVLAWIDELPPATGNVLGRPSLALDVQARGAEQRCEDEECEAEAVLQAEDACDGAGEAGREELNGV